VNKQTCIDELTATFIAPEILEELVEEFGATSTNNSEVTQC